MIIAITWKEYSEKILFAIQKLNGSGKVHNKIMIEFNQQIFRYYSFGEHNNFLDGQSPGIELRKLVIWEYGNSDYLCIQICIE